MAYFLLLLPLLLLFAVPPVYRADRESTAYRYTKNYLMDYYYQHKGFPNSFQVPGYPFVRYSHGGSRTTNTGIPKNQAWATVILAGKDREFGTGDDRVITLTASMLEQSTYKELYRRSNVLEQAAYNICQRRLAAGITPIWPHNLDEVIRDANLPTSYKYTPFGSQYTYDLTSCLTDSCYCTQAIVKAP